MSSGAGTAPWWTNVITWVLVLLGWLAVHYATLARERRKERRELAKAVIDALRSLELEALRFHTAATFDSILVDQLIYQTGRAIRSLQRVPMSDLNLPLGRMIRVRKTITLRNCDRSSFQTQRAGSPILLEIRGAVDDLVDSIEEARDARWP